MIYGQTTVAAVIVLVSLWAAISRQGVNNDIINTLLTIVVPALLASASATVYSYVFGANADDKSKRENLPAPVVDDEAGLRPPEGFGE